MMSANVSEFRYLKLLRTLLFIAFILFQTATFGQSGDSYVKNLKATVSGDRFLVSWTTKAGFSCQDIAVEFSTDSMTFVRKAVYYGICGDFDEKDYKIIVDSPFYNRPNYIRLDLGTFGHSYIIKAWIYKSETVLIFPHPIQSESKIYFSNPNREEAILQLYTPDGALVGEWNTNSDLFVLESMELPPFLIYRISLSGTIRFQGKLIVSS